MQRKVRPFFRIVGLFIALNGFFVVGKSFLEKWGADQSFLIGGNIVIFLVTWASFELAKRGLKSTNPHAFVQSIYKSVMIKFFACAIAAFVYISLHKDNLNKPALFTLMFLYLVYSFIEVAILTKMLKSKPNA